MTEPRTMFENPNPGLGNIVSRRRSGPLFLIGYRGAGKTAVAKVLGATLGWHWIDADAFLEEKAGRTIRQIFSESGEQAFRDLESSILAELAQHDRQIVATGGGVVLREANRAHLKKGTVVWLRAPATVLWERMQTDATTAERRPNLAQGGLAEIEEMLAFRTPLYEACQDFTVDAADRTPAEIAETIASWLTTDRHA